MQLTLSKKPKDGAVGDANVPVVPTSKVKAESLVGLDVSATGLCAVRVDGGRVRTASIADVDPSLMRDGEIADPDAMGAAIAEFFAANGMPKKVRMGVAGPRVVIRTIELPMIADDKQLDAAVRFQAQDHIPMPLDEAVLDYQVVGTVMQGDTHKLQVMLVAASKSLVEGLSATARKAGLKLQGIDHSAFALIRVMFPGGASASETIAYAHFGDMVNVTLAQGSVCKFTRATSTGFEAMLQRLCQRATLTPEHARMWVEHVGLLAPVQAIEGDPEIVHATRDELLAAADQLANDITAAIDFHTAQESGPHVARLMLSGPGSAVPGLADNLAARTGMQVEAPAALGALDTSSLDGSGIDERRLTLAAGLALEEVAAL
jgi:type IV pilus assembly protein PilM